MKVLSSVAIALYHGCDINFLELGFEILKCEYSLCESLPCDGECVLVRVNVRHCTVIPHKMFTSWSHPGVSQCLQSTLGIVWIPDNIETLLLLLFNLLMY